MAPPTLRAIEPGSGPAVGGDVVRLFGAGLGPGVLVRFGDRPAEIVAVSVDHVLLRAPAHPPGAVSIELQNLDDLGQPVPGEVVGIADAYRYQRARLLEEADLTRLVRTLLRELQSQLLANTSLAVHVDYDATPLDGQVAIAELPAVVVTGPRIRENRFYGSSEIAEYGLGPEVVRMRPPLTVDLVFSLTGASDRTVELLTLMSGVMSFLHRNRWLSMPRDHQHPHLGHVRWELDPEGELRTSINDRDGVHAFMTGLVVRGFDVDESRPLDVAAATTSTHLHTEPTGSQP